MNHRRLSRSGGAALLAAMLTVALVATLASAGLWQQWRTIEVEAAERQRSQSGWLLQGALDWARLILREDARAVQKIDHLGEPWAVPLLEARLSTFLAAQPQAATAEVAGETAFLSGEIIDLQSRLNINNLLDAGRPHAPTRRAFARLFNLLGLPQAQLETLVDNLELAVTAGRTYSRTPTDTETQQVPLVPQRPEQLGWLGLPPDTVSALQAYVTVLPQRTPVNLNTASAQVICAAFGNIGLADAQRIVAARASSYWRSPKDAERLVGQNLPDGELVGVSSQYFEVRGRLRLDRAVVEARTLVMRDGTNVRALHQQRGALGADAFTQPAPSATPTGR